jgi:lupus La protein
MSTELAASDMAPTTGIDKNAQAAEDAKKMLAELQGEATAETDDADASEEKTNGDVQEAKLTDEEENIEKLVKDKSEENESKTTNDRQDKDSGRSSRGGGRGRGGHPTRNYRDNIKSDLTTQEESSDPVAIRKQVLNDQCRL